MTTVAVLGGGGFVGRVAARRIAQAASVSRLVVADRDLPAALATAQHIGTSAEATSVDVSDDLALRALLASVDVVVNTVGPYYRFGLPILTAAIEVGTDYVDVCDDWEPTLQMLDLDDQARTAGVTAIIGAGYSPGASNLLAKAAMDRLDDVDRVVTTWPMFEDDLVSDPEVLAGRCLPGPSIVHLFHQLRGTVRIWRNGGYADVAPLEPNTIDVPGIGTIPIWLCGHPEAVTIPLLRPIRESFNAIATTESVVDLLSGIVRDADAKDLTNEQAAELFVERTRARGPVTDAANTQLPTLCAFVVGRSAGQSKTVAALSNPPQGHPSQITGLPLAVTATMLLDGEIVRRGVFAPERAVDPYRFFERLGRVVGDIGGPILEVREE